MPTATICGEILTVIAAEEPKERRGLARIASVAKVLT